MGYIRAHWQGQLGLGISLGLNLLGISLAIFWLEPKWVQWLAAGSGATVFWGVASLLLTRLVVLPWQVLGALRALETDFRANGHLLRLRLGQLLSLSTVAFSMVYAISLLQHVFYLEEKARLSQKQPPVPPYSLDVENQRVQLSGVIALGISQALRELLDQQPQVTTVVLQSRGGHIYEGRALAQLFIQRGLNTRVEAECSSACAMAFVGGARRQLTPGAKLGFHRYRLDASEWQGLQPALYDLRAEQQKDRALFAARGVRADFLAQMYQAGADDIWFPDQPRLLAVGVVTAVVDD